MSDDQTLSMGQVNTPAPLSMNPPAIAEPMDLRAVDDGVALRRNLYESVASAAGSMPPVVGKTHTLTLGDVDYADPEPNYTRAQETDILLGKKSATRRLRGMWSLINNATGEVVDQRKQVVANVPHVFDDGSIVLRGTRYVAGLQQRLRPGVYVRRRKNGESEAHVNVRSGTGPAHRYIMEPDTGRFLVNFGHSRVPITALLDILGADRKEVEAAWGKDIADINYGKSDPKGVPKLYERIVPKAKRSQSDGIPEMREKIRQAFDGMQIDDEVMQRTLGMSNNGKIDKNVILAATKKVLSTAKGDIDQDDRDHPAFATYHDLADIMSERIANDYARIRQQQLFKLASRNSLKNMPTGFLDKQLNAAVYNSGLVNSVEEINPLEVLDKLTRITRYGEGGLPSSQSTPKEARAVNPGQFGFIDTSRTTENLKVGVDVNASSHLKIGRDKKIYAPFIDNKTGQEVWRSPDQIADSVMSIGPGAIPGYEVAVVNGKLKTVKAGTADYRLANYENSFSHAGNLVPLKSNMFAQRIAMGARMAGQALPLENREARYVRSGIPGSNDADSFDNKMGRFFGAIRAKERAAVLDVKPDYIELAYAGGRKEKISIDHYRPTARKSYMHNEAAVRPGDTVEPGQLLARSNFTDNNGDVALGLNVKTAFLPYGENWEDAIIVSQRLADRMRVQTAYKHYLDKSQGDITGKKSFLATQGMTYDKKLIDNIDDDGVIKPGTIVNKGDPLILALRSKVDGGRVSKKGSPNYSNVSMTWDHNHPGEVVRVYKDEKGFNVVVKSSKPLEEADKLAGSFGNKGTIRIFPNEQMPVDESGDHIDALVSPLAVISRGNSSFPLEMALGKIAAKTGKPYNIEDFKGRNARQLVAEELKKHGLKDKETLIDPRNGRKIPGILTGMSYFMALHHMAESKGSGRGIGSYTSQGDPAKGPTGQAKRFSTQELYATLSQGGYKFNREVSMLRGRRNDEYWSAFMRGHNVAVPNINPAYTGFLDRLKSIGINPLQNGTKTQLLAMTDKDVDELSQGRSVTVPDTVDVHKDLSPIPGGLFDPKIFGDGDKFAKIDLPERTLNPVFEKPVQKILGLTEKQLRGVLSGQEELGRFGTGPEAILRRFKEVSLDQDIENARRDIAGNKKTARDAAIKRLGYLKAFKDNNMTPADLMVSSIPVMPPRLRPISRLGNKGNVVISDPNFLYREIMLAGDNLGQMKKYVEHPTDERLALYDSYKALIGLTEPTQYELKNRGVKGILHQISGDSPKTGYVQRKLLSTTVDTVGRGVIVPDSRLDMDSVGLPLSLAMKAFSPYVTREMVKTGMPAHQALQEVKDKSNTAVNVLQRVMQTRPVVFSRAPVLHRHGIFGLQGYLIPGDSVRLNPFVYKGANADNDGDTMNFHVPHSDDVVQEVRDRLMPSKMLTAQGDLKSVTATPGQDYLLGLYMASKLRKEKARVRTFEKFSDALAAFENGQLDVDDEVSVLEK